MSVRCGHTVAGRGWVGSAIGYPLARLAPAPPAPAVSFIIKLRSRYAAPRPPSCCSATEPEVSPSELQRTGCRFKSGGLSHKATATSTLGRPGGNHTGGSPVSHIEWDAEEWFIWGGALNQAKMKQVPPRPRLLLAGGGLSQRCALAPPSAPPEGWSPQRVAAGGTERESREIR